MFSGQNWFAAYTYPQQEAKVTTQLQFRGVEYFLPTYTQTRRWRNRQTVSLPRPLFPGYVFVRIGLRDRLHVLNASGVVSLVGCGGTPIPLPDSEIDRLQNAVMRIKAEPHPFLSIGDRVRVTSGPLEGFEGILLEKRGQHRLIVCMDLIMQAMSVEINPEQLEFVSRSGKALARSSAQR